LSTTLAAASPYHYGKEEGELPLEEQGIPDLHFFQGHSLLPLIERCEHSVRSQLERGVQDWGWLLPYCDSGLQFLEMHTNLTSLVRGLYGCLQAAEEQRFCAPCEYITDRERCRQCNRVTTHGAPVFEPEWLRRDFGVALIDDGFDYTRLDWREIAVVCALWLLKKAGKHGWKNRIAPPSPCYVTRSARLGARTANKRKRGT